MRKAEKIIFELIRTSLNKDCTIDDEVLKFADWNEMINITSAHGLSAIAFDGLEKALDCHPKWRNKVPTLLFLQWYGQFSVL